MHPYRQSSAPSPGAFRVGEHVLVALDAKSHPGRVGVVWFLSGGIYVVRFDQVSSGFYFPEQLQRVEPDRAVEERIEGK